MQAYPSFVTSLLCISVFINNVSAQWLNNNNIAFTIPEKGLFLNSIAYNSIKKRIPYRSTHKGKIVKVPKDGSQVGFIVCNECKIYKLMK